MNTLFYISLALVLSVAHGKSLAAEKRVQVQVYYETLCPDSIAFIINQLYPTFVALGKERIALELIPWGHASEQTVNGTKTFTCQHGAQECYGNKVHACAINSATIEQSMDFVFCSMGSNIPSDEINLKKCANLVGISWRDLQDCLSSGEADDLLSLNGEKTALVKPTFIPTIVIDGTFSQRTQDEALMYFKALICELLGYPLQCYN